MTVVVALGLAIGVLLGLLGGGGSILAVPALVYGAGEPLARAVPASLLVVGISSATALLPRLRGGQVRWRIALVFGASGMLAAFAGAAVNRLLPEQLVLLGFVAVMIAAGIRMLRPSGEGGGDCALPGGGVNWRGCLPKSIAAGVAVGFLIIPALVLLLGLPMTTAVGTSLVIVTLNSAAGFTAHAGSVQLDWQLLAAFTGAAITGSLLAGRVAKHIDAQRLQRGFAVLVLATASAVVLQVTTS